MGLVHWGWYILGAPSELAADPRQPVMRDGDGARPVAPPPPPPPPPPSPHARFLRPPPPPTPTFTPLLCLALRIRHALTGLRFAQPHARAFTASVNPLFLAEPPPAAVSKAVWGDLQLSKLR